MKRRPALIVLLPAALLAGCAANLDPGGGFSLGAGATAQFAFQPVSMAEKRFETVVRQNYDFSCGSAALATLLTYHYGMNRDEAAVFMGMWEEGDQAQIRQLGFSLLDMKRYLERYGVTANGYAVTLDQVAEAGVPGIALIAPNGYRHFVVVKGMEGDQLLLGDPSLGLTRMSRKEFEDSWTGVYFVVTEGLEAGGLAFNAPAQWSRLATAPLGDPFLEPLSQQALNLTAPFYTDF